MDGKTEAPGVYNPPTVILHKVSSSIAVRIAFLKSSLAKTPLWFIYANPVLTPTVCDTLYSDDSFNGFIFSIQFYKYEPNIDELVNEDLLVETNYFG